MADSQTRALARRLAALERQTLLRKKPSLAYSSIDEGALVATVDGDVTVIIGAQHDGTNTAVPVVGPPPPQPVAPTLEPVAGGLIVRWDGTYADSPTTVSPMDWTRTDIVVNGDPMADFIATPPSAAFVSARGGEIFLSLTSNQAWSVALVARSQPGKASTPSAVATATPLAAPDQQDIDAINSLIDQQAVQITDNTGAIQQTQSDLSDVQITAQDAMDKATTADGRVVISDYEPGPEDVAGKVDGSMWITRTRDRINQAPNPSFETNITGYTGTAAALSRVAVTGAPDSNYAMRVTNDATTGLHYAAVSAPLSVTEGQDVAISAYAQWVSGLGTGLYAEIVFRDGAGATLATVDGTATTLATDGTWGRLAATGTAPVGAVDALTRWVNPNASDAWNIDAVLVEYDNKIGRYFDGGSQGGEWLGTPELSTSHLIPGAIIRLFTLEDGGFSEKFWTADTISSVDASTIDRGEMNGGFLADNTIPVDKQYTDAVQASEALAAGDLVNIWNNGGLYKVRKAKANPGYEAEGFVLDATASGAQVRVYTNGYNPLLQGLAPGIQFLSVTPGKATSAPPQDTGTIVQRVGVAPNSNTLNFAALTSVSIT